MAYDFKNLNEVPAQDAPTENTTVMAFESGNPRQIPAGEFGGKVIVIDGDDENTFNWDTMECVVNYDPIYEALENGRTVIIAYSYTLDDGTAVKARDLVVRWELYAGKGFAGYTWNYPIYFTNGSYHTA